MRFGALLASFVSVLVGCGGGAKDHGTPCSSTTDCPAGLVCKDGTCQMAPSDGGAHTDFGDPHAHDVVSIAIVPPSATLTSTDMSMPTQSFMAVATLADGTTAPAHAPTWATDFVSLGTLDTASGDFVASGIVGGTANITVTVDDPTAGTLTAHATLTVDLVRTVLGPGADGSTPGRFGAPTSDPTMEAHVVYPLDQVVMPQNVYPANVQWTSQASGDAFRIALHKTHVDAVGYVVDPAGLDWLVDASAWRAVAQTDPDEQAVLTVQRLVAATGATIDGTPVHLTFAKGSIVGTVYYWSIAEGRIQRIDDGSGTAVSFMPNPPVAVDGNRCVGCHSVSRSGRYMAGRLGGSENIGAVFDLTVDLSGDPPPTVWPISTAPPSAEWYFSTWNQDDTRLMLENNMVFSMLDPMTGAVVTPVSGTLPSSASTHPNWAPDGHAIAYLANVTGWGGDNSSGDIALLPVTGPDSFGTSTVIHSGGSLGDLGTVDAYPSYAPDSHHLAFAHGNNSRSATGQSALWYMSEDGSGVVRMNAATGGASSTLDFQPRFSPFDVAGYWWLSFLSRRDYGNAQSGTAGAGRQQIWITAIRKDAGAGTDPSAVPYWLPGQSTASQNIAAYWAPRPCRDEGASCDVGSECCSGDCRPPPGGGAPVCSPPPPERCHHEGETCSTDADCCMPGLSCTMHVCQPPFG